MVEDELNKSINIHGMLYILTLHLLNYCGPSSSVGIATELRAGQFDFALAELLWAE